MTKLTELEQRIRKAIPSLMELSEGCLIQSHNYKDIREVYRTKQLFHNERKKYEKAYITHCEQFYCELTFEDDIQKIIGHSIRLNDVLLWVKNKRSPKYNKIAKEYPHLNANLHDIVDCWNLESNLLSDQSEELINFLYKLE